MTAIALALMAALALAQHSAPAGVSASPSRCDFGVVRGEPVTCTFAVHNAGDAPRRITGVKLRQPLTMRRAPAVIAAGGEVMYQRGGRDFDVRISIDSPAVEVTAVRGPQGDRYQATLAYVPGALVIGPVRATLVIETNDSGFGRIEVPVRSTVLPSP